MIFNNQIIILSIFLGWLVFCITQAVNWKQLSKEEDYLPKNHFIIQTKKIIENNFAATGGDFTDVDLIFGIKDLDKNGIKWWEPNLIG